MSTYDQLLRETRSLIGTDVRTRFKIAELLTQLCAMKSAAEVAEDVSMKLTEVENFTRTAKFWGRTRIRNGPQGAQADWALYQRTACTRNLTEEQRTDVKAHAHDERGPLGVRYRIDRHIGLNQKAERAEYEKARRERTPGTSEHLRKAIAAEVQKGVAQDLRNLVQGAEVAIQNAADYLDRLGTLSEEDAEELVKPALLLIEQLQRLDVLR